MGALALTAFRTPSTTGLPSSKALIFPGLTHTRRARRERDRDHPAAQASLGRGVEAKAHLSRPEGSQLSLKASCASSVCFMPPSSSTNVCGLKIGAPHCDTAGVNVSLEAR